MSWIIGSDWDESEIEWAAEFTDFFEGWAVRKVFVGFSIVVFAFGNFGDGAVT